MGLFNELMKRVSKPKDIQLPNKSGRIDPRLPQEGFRRAAEGLKALKKKF